MRGGAQVNVRTSFGGKLGAIIGNVGSGLNQESNEEGSSTKAISTGVLGKTQRAQWSEGWRYLWLCKID